MVTDNNLLLYKKILPKLSSNAFYAYMRELFTHCYDDEFVAIKKNNNSIYRRVLGDGFPDVPEGAYIFHYFFDFYKDKTYDQQILQDPLLLKKIDYVNKKYNSEGLKNKYGGWAYLQTIFLITNFHDYDNDIYVNKIMPSLDDLLKKRQVGGYGTSYNGLDSTIGSYDTIFYKKRNENDIKL